MMTCIAAAPRVEMCEQGESSAVVIRAVLFWMIKRKRRWTRAPGRKAIIALRHVLAKVHMSTMLSESRSALRGITRITRIDLRPDRWMELALITVQQHLIRSRRQSLFEDKLANIVSLRKYDKRCHSRSELKLKTRHDCPRGQVKR